MIEWFKKHFGRRSKVDMLIRALPDPRQLATRTRLWAETLRDFGDAAERWEPEESILVGSIKDLADAADLFGPMIDDALGGDDKRIALVAKLRYVAVGLGMADDVFDAFWTSKGRPRLDRYIARVRALPGGTVSA